MLAIHQSCTNMECKTVKVNFPKGELQIKLYIPISQKVKEMNKVEKGVNEMKESQVAMLVHEVIHSAF